MRTLFHRVDCCPWPRQTPFPGPTKGTLDVGDTSETFFQEFRELAYNHEDEPGKMVWAIEMIQLDPLTEGTNRKKD